jgi:sterol desaturase/sphingolipid hydroxylase (fatty acid hydroxylase superfamily)
MFTILAALVSSFWPLLLTIALALALERVRPWTGRGSGLRWLHAIVLYAASILATYIVLPLGLVGLAALAEERGLGLSAWIGLPGWAALLAGLVILDFMHWLAHWAQHASPLLWRLHRIHHSDTVIDASTAFRFHPLENLFRFAANALAILAFGIPPGAVFATALLVMVFDVWEHADIRVPAPLARLAPWLITPELHRLHHSIEAAHNNRNLGTVLTVWDRLFGTYAPPEELDRVTGFGLSAGPASDHGKLTNLLLDPLRRG